MKEDEYWMYSRIQPVRQGCWAMENLNLFQPMVLSVEYGVVVTESKQICCSVLSQFLCPHTYLLLTLVLYVYMVVVVVVEVMGSLWSIFIPSLSLTIDP